MSLVGVVYVYFYSILWCQLLLVVASYINSLEADRAKLKSQVRRLCEENGWLRQELIQHQQQLSEMETKLGKMQEEKKQLEFVATLPSWVEKRKSNEELPLPNCDEEGTDPGTHAIHV